MLNCAKSRGLDLDCEAWIREPVASKEMQGFAADGLSSKTTPMRILRVMPGMRDVALREIRATRAAPPGRASTNGPRRKIYGAAVQQFEELLGAAGSVGPASRPLLLFYALSQAGRAIVAAHGERPEVLGHGLAEAKSSRAITDVLQFRVKRVSSKIDLFGAVARATHSGEIAGSVPLGAVWAATPGTYRLPADAWRDDWATALTIGRTTSGVTGETVFIDALSMSGPPEPNGVTGIEQRLQRYPTLPPDAAKSVGHIEDLAESGDWMLSSSWPLKGHWRSLDDVAPKNVLDGDRWLIPRLPDEAQLLSPLMLWWVLLFGLSLLARYEPALWANALAVDRSDRAVPLEVLLNQAVDALPTLVYSALIGLFHPVPPNLRAVP